jgi:serine/threonine protein kinase
MLLLSLPHETHRSAVPLLSPCCPSAVSLDATHSNRYVTTELVLHNQLSHPHVIKFQHVWLSSNHINVVMELANAGSVFTFIRQSGGQLPEHVARSAELRQH